ncbi:hypothetical protein [Pyrococcus kukulkanii]|uniref:Uncharacterized protein n=1 Tax=Pyrococcus kukulkanii TaxID=1609559 RepID=A0ABV4T5U8_9EURY
MEVVLKLGFEEERISVENAEQLIQKIIEFARSHGLSKFVVDAEILVPPEEGEEPYTELEYDISQEFIHNNFDKIKKIIIRPLNEAK